MAFEMTPAELKQARQSLGLTQSQIARLLGYSAQPNYSAVETGAKNPSAAVTRLLRAYLDGYRPPDWPA